MNVAVNGKQAIGEKADCGAPDQRPSIVLTTMDHERLIALLNAASIEDSSVVRFLRDELDRADVVIGTVETTSLVTMGCEVTFIDHESERIRQVRLVYPDEVNSDHYVSVLSALGSALIGLGPGQSIRWNDHGKARSLTVIEIHPKCLTD